MILELWLNSSSIFKVKRLRCQSVLSFIVDIFTSNQFDTILFTDDLGLKESTLYIGY